MPKNNYLTRPSAPRPNIQEREADVFTRNSSNRGHFVRDTELIIIKEMNIPKGSFPLNPNVDTYNPGELPDTVLVQNKRLVKNLGPHVGRLIPEASESLDAMFTELENVLFAGKQSWRFIDAYRSKQDLDVISGYLARKGTPYLGPISVGTHGQGIAVDIFWGVTPHISNSNLHRPVAFRHPMYQWFFFNAPRFGWAQPPWCIDNQNYDEFWHWEFFGTTSPWIKEFQNRLPSVYSAKIEPFDDSVRSRDIMVLEKYGSKYNRDPTLAAQLT